MGYNEIAIEFNVGEIQQQYISTCSSILNNTNLLLQNLLSISAIEFS